MRWLFYFIFWLLGFIGGVSLIINLLLIDIENKRPPSKDEWRNS